MLSPKIYLILIVLLCSSFSDITWGFYGHRLINRMSIFLLPEPLFGYYKSHLDYVQNHAIDPDKRRYGVKAEGPRHYMDLDHWSSEQIEKFKELSFKEVVIATSDYTITHNGNERLLDKAILNSADSILFSMISAEIDSSWLDIVSYGKLTIENVSNTDKVVITDRFTEHGILPYHLNYYANRLEQAFKEENFDLILKYSAEIGHYIADAHVPLHTTSNYNGQLTNQVGIHAFWETRIPELFAETEYDFFINEAEYIHDWKSYFWDMILDTHLLVDEVLQVEKDLRNTVPKDLQYCYEERNGKITRLECSEYAEEYSDRMNGMVERQMQKSIHSISSVWFTAYANAGMPDLPTDIVNETLELPIEENHQLRNK